MGDRHVVARLEQHLPANQWDELQRVPDPLEVRGRHRSQQPVGGTGRNWARRGSERWFDGDAHAVSLLQAELERGKRPNDADADSD